MRQIVRAKLPAAALTMVCLAAASAVAVEPEGPRKAPVAERVVGESHAVQVSWWQHQQRLRRRIHRVASSL